MELFATSHVQKIALSNQETNILMIIVGYYGVKIKFKKITLLCFPFRCRQGLHITIYKRLFTTLTRLLVYFLLSDDEMVQLRVSMILGNE